MEINDATSLQAYSQTFAGPAVPDSLCEAAAYEQSPYPHYDVTTQTSPIGFNDLRVRWSDSTGIGTSKLLGTPPADGHLYRYTLINAAGATVAVTSKPMYSNNDVTITDR